MRTTVLALVLLPMLSVACSDSSDDSDTMMPLTPMMQRAELEMNAVIIGPVQNDDNLDMRITLRETNGVSARLNFLRLTCNNGSQQQWGAGNISAERGTNLIEGHGEVVLVRRYSCRASGRPFRLEANLDDVNGNSITVITAPFHPDWPGA